MSTANNACATTYTVSNPTKNNTFTLNAGDALIIPSNVNFGGAIIVQGSNAMITNNGEITSNGIVTVNAGYSGTVINNLGQVNTNNVFLNSPTTVNNGSSDGGVTVVAAAVWTSYIGTNFVAVTTINNYSNWAGQLSTPFQGTINNSGNWSIFTSIGGPTTINNSGTWNGGQLNYTGSLTINHTGGTWSADLNGGTVLTLNNSGNWTKAFNTPSTGPNAFNTLAGGTADVTINIGGGGIAIQNSGTMTLRSSTGALPSGSSVLNNANSTLTFPTSLSSSGVITNAGTLNFSAGFTNSGTVANTYRMAITGNFTNSGTVTGAAVPFRGSITATGTTVNTSTGNFGSTGRLDFCDATPPNPASNGFDSRAGTIGAATSFCSLRPLPVELIDFTAEVAKGQVLLRWNTASERNSAKFVVERSATGEAFAAVQEVRAQGNAARPTAYAATDAAPLRGLSYYRLRQVDTDGAAAYSPVAAISTKAEAVLAYPNPAPDRITLDLSTAPAEACQVHLVSLTGQVVLAQTLAGGRVQELPLAGLPAGLYLLHVRTPQGSTVQRIQKQ